ncbi:MAG: helicase c2 [Spirochaetales bacterium]|nr:helicase c2 [Spirochaetales bacterium]
MDRLFFSNTVQKMIAAEIADAGGQEVMFVGRVSQDREISSAVPVARGNGISVPALLPHAEKGDIVVHNHPSGKLNPSQADLAVASYLGNQGIGFAITNNEADELYIVAEPMFRKEKQDLDADSLEGIFLPGGSLAAHISDYEVRDAQVEMLRVVSEALNNGLISVIEAGTGVGKSLAYLVPAIRWASDNDERVVISTATINLQQQLLEKDIPLAEKALGLKVKTALVKGRGNYICLRRLRDELEEPSLFDDEKKDLQVLADWAENSATGNKSDLSWLPDQQLWQRVCSETDTCTGLRCALREKCFVIRARKEAAQAQLLIVNHHLLFSDIALRMAGIGYDAAAVLPPFQRIIFDEAHSLEKSATSFFSRIFTRNSINRQLSRLLSTRKGTSRGLLPRLHDVYADVDIFAGLDSEISELRAQTDFFNEKCLFRLADHVSLRVTAANRKELDADFFPILADYQQLLGKNLNQLQKLVNLCRELLDQDDEHLVELQSVLSRLDAILSMISDFIRRAPEDGFVYWLERKRGSRGDMWVEFSITPVDISDTMREAVFSQYESIVCTSATLMVNRSFEFWLKRIGLFGFSEREIGEYSFPSPFPYKTNAMLCIPADSPDPTSAAYADSLKKQLAELLLLTEGRALVLFTSYSMLEETHAALHDVLDERGIRIFRQGDDDRSRLLDKFKNDTSSVLFATDSFWEGVDSPGDTLQVVVICRLPFRVPDEPIVKARMEEIEKKGGNPFMDLSLPEAVMKFKQGFGRLMRKKSDKGIVVIYDSRIVSKFYGRFFLNSLPETAMSVKEHSSMLEDVEHFLY